jgi:hypothetical protein
LINDTRYSGSLMCGTCRLGHKSCCEITRRLRPSMDQRESQQIPHARIELSRWKSSKP